MDAFAESDLASRTPSFADCQRRVPPQMPISPDVSDETMEYAEHGDGRGNPTPKSLSSCDSCASCGLECTSPFPAFSAIPGGSARDRLFLWSAGPSVAKNLALGEVYPMNDGRDADSWHEFVARATSPVEPAAYADFTTMRFDNMPAHPPEIGGDETSWPLIWNGSGFAVVGIWRNRDARRRIRTAAFYG
jgi:hypothetical protein